MNKLSSSHDASVASFLHWCRDFGASKHKKIVSTFWIDTIWTIWKCRNELIFDGIVACLDKVIDELKARLWSWLTVKVPEIKNSTFSEWLLNPVGCCGL